MADFRLYYDDGQEIKAGNRVVYASTLGVISEVIYPGSPESRDWEHPQGGFLLDLDDGGSYLLSKGDEDLKLISRAKN